MPTLPDDATHRAFADRLPVICWAADRGGRLRWLNARFDEYAGLSEGDAETRWRTARGQTEIQTHQPGFAEATPFQWIDHLTGADGRRRAFLVEAQPQSDGWTGVCTEVTAQVEAAKLRTFMVRLGDLTRAETDPDRILALTSEAVGRELGADRVVYGVVDWAAGLMHMSADWRSDGACWAAHRFPLSAYNETHIEAHSRGDPINVEHMPTDMAFTATARERFAAAGVVAFTSVPLVKEGIAEAIMTAQQFTRRVWTDYDRRILGVAAERTWDSLERARSEAHLASAMRRREFLLALSDRLRGEADPTRILKLSASALGDELAVDAIDFFEIAAGERPALTGLSDILTADRTLVVDDVTAADLDLTDQAKAALTAQGAVAAIVVPVTAERGLAGVLTIHLTSPRHWTEGEVELAEAVAERSWEAMERARAREALNQAEKLTALGSLLAGVSHELNNPLSILTAQSTLLEEMAGPGPLADRALKVRRAADRCSRIVQTFLAMARQKPPERRQVQAADVARSALELTEYPLRTAGVAVTFDAEPSLPPLQADPDQLHQVLVNLLVNAQQALEERPAPRRIAVRVRRSADRADAVCIEVTDNGPGVPPEIRRRIFEPFFTTKPQGTGTGVGLSFSMGLVEAHGGRLELVDGEDGGACFRVTLEAARDGDGATPQETSSATLSATGPRGRALVVDDEPDLAEAVAIFAGRAGFAVDIAIDGAHAIELLGKADYAAILSDLRMPGLDGPALHDWIVQNKPQFADRIGFITGDTLGQSAAIFLERTGRPVIEKPFTPAAVGGLLDILAPAR